MIRDLRKKFSLQVHQCGYQAVMSFVITMQVSLTVMIFITQEKSHGYTSTGGNFKMRRKYENPALSYCKVVILSTSWKYFISFTFSYTMLKGSVFTHV